MFVTDLKFSLLCVMGFRQINELQLLSASLVLGELHLNI